MPLDIKTLTEALADLGSQSSVRLRFAVECPKCGHFVWTSEDQIGNQINCQECNEAVTVAAPESEEPTEAELAIIAAGTPLHMSPYTIVADLNLFPSSTLEEMFLAFHAGSDKAEALRLLRDTARRFAHDLICYPHWQTGDSAHGP